MSTPKLRQVPVPVDWGHKDCRRYEVSLDGNFIGYVESKRSESWRTNGRIRTSRRGSPKHWEAEAEGWTPVDARFARDRRVGYHFHSRASAVRDLVDAYLLASGRTPLISYAIAGWECGPIGAPVASSGDIPGDLVLDPEAAEDFYGDAWVSKRKG